MTNSEISRLFRNIAAAYSIKDEQKYRFQLIAYQKAADIIEHSVVELAELYKEGKLDSLQGIGSSIKSHLEELFEKGKVGHFEAVFKGVPEAVFPLLDIPGFGPKKAYRLVSEFKLKNAQSVISDVASLAKSNKIAGLAGFGEKSESDILRAIDEFRRGKTKTARMLLSYADELATKILIYLKTSQSVIEAYPLGSLRRRMPTVGDIDIAVSSRKAEETLEHFVNYPHIERVIEKGIRSSSIIVSSGRQIDLMVATPESFGALLQHFTGSKAHNIHLRDYALSKGLSLSDYGIKKKSEGKEARLMEFDSEEKFYGAVGMDWVPPEMREDKGEVELALRHDLPKLVEHGDIKADFHLHSSFPIEPSHDMGQDSMEDMVKKAMELKYEYVGFSEHNPSFSKHKKSQIQDILKVRSNLIEHLKSKYNKFIRIFSLLEVDILTNGNLALDNEGMSLLDGAIVSVHSSFDLDKEKMTERVLKGLSHKKARILAHPTGRLLNQRPGYELNWDKIFAFCKENKKAIEINASPMRLDLPDDLVRRAVDAGVTLVINTDSHAIGQMDLMRYGVFVARRGWAKKSDILNTKSYNEIEKWFNEGR